MPENDLTAILSRLDEDSDHRTSFPECWSQGRSAFGGLSASFAVCAMKKLLPSPTPLRSLMVSFIGPIPPGEIEARPKLVRQGKNVTQASAEVVSEGKVCLQAMAAFGKHRGGLEIAPMAKFDPLPREGGQKFETVRKRLPNFLQFFEGCWAGPGVPFSGAKARNLTSWVKHKNASNAFPEEKLVCIADLPPPVLLSHYDTPPVPASSLTWSLEFLVDPREISSDWFYLEYTAEAAAQGYTQQSGLIFDETGVLCAISRQCMVYFDT